MTTSGTPAGPSSVHPNSQPGSGWQAIDRNVHGHGHGASRVPRRLAEPRFGDRSPR